MRFWLIYEVLGVWVDGLLLDYFTTSPEMKGAENEREERDGREDIILRYIILLCRYIILRDKYSKPTWGLARFHFTYPWFKTLHFAHLNFNPLAFRNPPLRLPSEKHIFRQKQT